jgi:hypothetical protein
MGEKSRSIRSQIAERRALFAIIPALRPVERTSLFKRRAHKLHSFDRARYIVNDELTAWCMAVNYSSMIDTASRGRPKPMRLHKKPACSLGEDANRTGPIGCPFRNGREDLRQSGLLSPWPYRSSGPRCFAAVFSAANIIDKSRSTRRRGDLKFDLAPANGRALSSSGNTCEIAFSRPLLFGSRFDVRQLDPMNDQECSHG